MEHAERLRLAKEALKQRAEQYRYCISWRGGGDSEYSQGLDGFNAIATMLNVCGGTLGNYFSRGKNSFERKLLNPTTGELDIATISRALPVKEQKPRGRPRKVVDWERLGTEAPGNPNGTIIAESARTMPKRTNRRTREK